MSAQISNLTGLPACPASEFSDSFEELARCQMLTNSAFRLYILLSWKEEWTAHKLRCQFFRDGDRTRHANPPTKLEIQKDLQRIWRAGLAHLTIGKGRATTLVDLVFSARRSKILDLGNAWIKRGPDVPISRPPIKKAIRDAVLARDGRVCSACGTEKQLTIDHIRPVSRGGTDDLFNLQVLCRNCNSRKHAKYAG